MLASLSPENVFDDLTPHLRITLDQISAIESPTTAAEFDALMTMCNQKLQKIWESAEDGSLSQVLFPQLILEY